MSYKGFKNWLISEFKDVFGFDSELQTYKFSPKKFAGAIDPLKSEIILGELSKIPLGIKPPIWDWNNTVEWGNKNNTGSIKIDISPLGSYKAIIRKLSLDLEGNKVWICKNIIPFNEVEKDNHELEMASIIHKKLEKIDEELIDGANAEFPKLENLVINLASKVKRFAPQIFMFEGIKKLSDNNYLIYMEYRGQGVEAPGGRRVEQFNIELNFDPIMGLLHCWGYEISSPTNQHIWLPQPSEWDEYFAPSQSVDEIIEAVVNALKTY